MCSLNSWIPDWLQNHHNKLIFFFTFIVIKTSNTYLIRNGLQTAAILDCSLVLHYTQQYAAPNQLRDAIHLIFFFLTRSNETFIQIKAMCLDFG